MVLRNNDSPSEGDSKWLRVKKDQYYLQFDFEKDQANTNTRQHLHQQSEKGLI